MVLAHYKCLDFKNTCKLFGYKQLGIYSIPTIFYGIIDPLMHRSNFVDEVK